MVKCPFCSFANEDGALFCEQCKSDISSVAPVAAAPAAHPPTPMPESFIPAAEAVPMAALDEAPVMAAIVEDGTTDILPVASVEEPPMAAALVESLPLEPVALAAVEAAPPAPIAEARVAPPPPPPAPVVAEVPPPPPVPPTPALVMAAAAVVAPPAAKPAVSGAALAAGAEPKLVVQRGLKIGEEYGIFPGENYIGRADEKPVDVDLTFQEPEDRVWTSRQHALLNWDDAAGVLTIEDLNSSNGTFVNRERVYPGQPRQLFVGNTVQIGTVHMRVKV